MTLFWWLILFFIDRVFRLKSVICKKYTNFNGKYSNYTNAINISIIWSCGGGVGNAGSLTAWIVNRAASFIAWTGSRAGSFIAWIGSISATFFCISKKTWNKHGFNFWTFCFWFGYGEGETCYEAAWKTMENPWKHVVHLFQMWEQQCFFHCKTGQVCWRGNVCIQRVPRLPQQTCMLWLL